MDQLDPPPEVKEEGGEGAAAAAKQSRMIRDAQTAEDRRKGGKSANNGQVGIWYGVLVGFGWGRGGQDPEK